MSESPAALTVPASLAARLRHLTGALAAARTRAEVLDLAFQGAAALFGAAGVAQGPGLSGERPAAVAGTGAAGPVDHLALPLDETGALGTLALDFRPPRTLAPAERRALEALAHRTGLALRRADLLAELEADSPALTESGAVPGVDGSGAGPGPGTAAPSEEQAALRTFVRFSEAASHATTMEDLTRLALHALREILPGSTAGFYERRGESWWPRLLDDRISDDLRGRLEQGLAPETPVMAQMIAQQAPVFIDDWDEAEQDIAHTAEFQAVALYPVGQGGEIVAALAVGLEAPGRWDARSRGLVEALGRSFALLHERVAAAEELQCQRLEAQRQVQVLSAFAQLARHLLRETDRYALIRQAQQIVLSLLPRGCAVYWEPEGGLWRIRAQTGQFGHEDIQQAASAGLPLDMALLAGPWATGEALYQDRYAAGTDIAAAPQSQMQTAASLPLKVGGQLIGVFVVGLFEQRTWTQADRTMLDTAAQSLSLALERAQGALALADRTAELERANRDLQTSNEELEAFTYSASHDLRAPVRHVQGFAEMAQRALDKDQPGKAREYLGVVTGAADRMTAMIDAMLVLSRAGRTEMRTQSVPLAALTQRAQQDARMEFPDQAVEWDVGDLPAVQGDPVSLQQVMTNLLSNAVKYSQGPAPARVRVWAEDRPGEVAVFVQDHGVGYDPRYARKLFGAFQRLHTQADFPGTGIGLATVRRIVSRHGGQVTAQGEPGAGATFGFTLPRP
ncbi:ATP-binding protein [uncultured Deinococcus sp.]|uniref:sensor histidine kinase n=1 Tax=uncultured Deinococcus sp. TaxID=158789 RepID=UPI0025842695|nr:ATP-binding protein [uncultured Deinococcus sp.]